MIYLSWSLWELVFFLLFILVGYIGCIDHAMRIFSSGERNRAVRITKVATLAAVGAILLLAFDIADRKAVHNRVNYDLTTQEVPEKKEVVAPTAGSVYNDFSNTLNNTGETK